MFRRFEFRGLLNRIDKLDEAVPAAERASQPGEPCPWRIDEPSDRRCGPGGVAVGGDRVAAAVPTTSVVVGRFPSGQ